MSEQRDTFREFVSGRSAALMRTAFLLTGDHQHAEDLVQSALFKSVRVWSRIQANPEAYVRRIMVNENISRWRRRRVHEVTLVDLPAHLPAEAPDPDVRLTLLAALDRLTTKQRTVLVLRFFEDLTEVQTAALLGIGPGTVKSQTRQALDRLRTLAPELSDLLVTTGDRG